MASLSQQEPSTWSLQSPRRETRSGTAPASSSEPDLRFREERLARTIESEIIPRLLLAHRDSRKAAQSNEARRPGPSRGDVEQFAQLLLSPEIGPAWALIQRFRDGQLALENVFLDLFAPAARHLGDLWVEDRCDFVDVTMGLSRMQGMLRDLSNLFERENSGSRRVHRILLTAVPGEQHTFGLSLVEEFFRRAGWDVCIGGCQTVDELIRLLGTTPFAVVGLSVSGDPFLGSVGATIRAIRKASQNPAIGVIVGGRIFNDRPDMATLIGADATAIDARDAVVQAEALIRLNGCQPSI